MNVYQKTTVLTVAAFLAAGIASATLLSSFGSISGTADVEEPTFNAEASSELVPNSFDEDVTGNSQPIHTNPPEFVYESGSEWYPSNVSFQVEVRDDGDEDDSDVNHGEGTVEAVFSMGDESCSKEFTVDKDGNENYQTKTFECEIEQSGNGDIVLEFNQIEGTSYLKYNQDDTRVEVSSNE